MIGTMTKNFMFHAVVKNFLRKRSLKNIRPAATRKSASRAMSVPKVMGRFSFSLLLGTRRGRDRGGRSRSSLGRSGILGRRGDCLPNESDDLSLIRETFGHAEELERVLLEHVELGIRRAHHHLRL